jgi:transcription-repair coupling factor (superfamily II helicase)
MPLPDSKQMRLRRLYPDAVYKPVTEQVSVVRPTEGRGPGAEPLRDTALLTWATELVTTVLGEPAPAPAATPASR